MCQRQKCHSLQLQSGISGENQPAGTSWHPSGVEPLSWQKCLRLSHENTQPLWRVAMAQPFREEQRALLEQGRNARKDSFPSFPLGRSHSCCSQKEFITENTTNQVLEQADSHLLRQCDTRCGTSRDLCHHISSLRSLTETWEGPLTAEILSPELNTHL